MSDLHRVKVNSDACCEFNFSFGLRPSVCWKTNASLRKPRHSSPQPHPPGPPGESKGNPRSAHRHNVSGGSRVWPGASDQVPEPSQLTPFRYLSSSHSLRTSLLVTKMVLTMIVKLSKCYFINAETGAEHR